MSTVTTGLYPFDPYGTNPANHILEERHTLHPVGRDEYLFIIPKAAPFFVNSLKVYNDNTNTLLVEGRDYLIGHQFVEAMDSTGKPIAGSLRFLNRELSTIIRLEYRTLGGPWGFDDQAILAELSNKLLNPITRSWGMIEALPASFPPIAHDQSLDSFVGSEELLGALETLTTAVVEASQGVSTDHINDKNNPHGTTAEHLGLGLVANHPPATEAKAIEGLDNASTMTPRMTRRAIEAIALAALDEHLNDRDNPHRTTKAHLGLDRVANYAPANDAEAAEGLRNDLYLTPRGGRLLMESSGEGPRITELEQRLTAHINNRENPHQVTAQQTGAYDRDEVNALLSNVSAQDTPRFAGLTEAEWRESLPDFEMISDLCEALEDSYYQGAGDASTLPVTAEPPSPHPEIDVLSAHRDGYTVYFDDGTYLCRPFLGFSDGYLQGTPGTFARHLGAFYYVNEHEHIQTGGTNPHAMPPSYSVGAEDPPDDPVSYLHARQERVYALLDSGAVMSIQNGNGTIVVSQDVVAFHGNVPSEALPVNHNILIMADGTARALGDTSFVNQANSVLSGITGIVQAAVGEQAFFILQENGTVTGWRINNPGGAVTLTPIDLGTMGTYPYTSISGCYRHFHFVNADSRRFNTYSVDPADRPYIDPDFGVPAMAVAGFGFSVTVSQKGEIMYWGDSDDNRLLAPVV